MSLANNFAYIWSFIRQNSPKISFRRVTREIPYSIWIFIIFLLKSIYQTITNPEKLTIGLSKTAERISLIKIPHFVRQMLFNLYSKYYKVKLNELIQPLDSFETFSHFFTRKVQPRHINLDARKILAPADSKILKISEITYDQCSIIKGASYSLGQLLTGQKIKLTPDEIQALKKNPRNKIYQVIFYLAPGDYHRFHSPSNFEVESRKNISGVLLSVSEKTLIKRKKVYQKNGRVVLNGNYNNSEFQQSMYMSLVMVGALNVGKIEIRNQTKFDKGQQIGYFNLGSTIVMLFESKQIKQWQRKEGELIRYGDQLCEITLPTK